MNDVPRVEEGFTIPRELQQNVPRKVRLSGRGTYSLVGSAMVSVAIAVFIIVVGSLTPREIRNRNELKREGKVAYTNDVRVGGMRSATVFYSFAYDGRTYEGQAFLPHQYLGDVLSYSRHGGFPVLFLPRNPSINHPYGWGSGPFPYFLYIFVAILVIQWSILTRYIVRDLHLARYGLMAIATVTGCGLSHNGSVLLNYEFRDMDGLLTKGSGECLDRRGVGEKVCVLYLPEETSKSRPNPPVFFRATI